jgi:hypothetical protein
MEYSMAHVHVQLSVRQLLQVAFGKAAISVCAVSWDVHAGRSAFAGLRCGQGIGSSSRIDSNRREATAPHLLLLLLLEGWAFEQY